MVGIAGFQCHAIHNIIDQNKNQNHSIIKSRIWEMKGGKYAKNLAKIQVTGIFRIRDI